jgi:sulfur-oxidizing protein SoxY
MPGVHAPLGQIPAPTRVPKPSASAGLKVQQNKCFAVNLTHPTVSSPISQESKMKTRRDTLKHSAVVAGLLAGAGLYPLVARADFNKAAFEAKTLSEALKAINASGAPQESKDITLTAPDIAENGAVVPLGAATTLAGVRQLLLLVEKNPSALIAIFNLTDSIDANVSTRAKMAQTSEVYAVAIMNDGKALFAKKEVKVTLGGCGG